MYFHKPQEKPRKRGSFQDVQYAIRKNAEKIYQIDPDSMVLCIPLFWGLPLLDYSGYNNHGTNHGATYKDGGLSFDGVGNYVDVGDIDIAGNSLTLIAQIKPNFDPSNVGYDYIMDKAGNGNAAAWRLAFNNGIDDFRFRLFTASGGTNCDTTGLSWSAGESHYIATVYNGSTMKIYWDGVEENSVNKTGNITTNDVNLCVGYSLGDSDLCYFDGNIDAVSISNVGLTADQIALFHDRPWALYQPVSRPVYFFQAAAGLSIPVAMQNMRGGFNPIGMRGGFINAD